MINSLPGEERTQPLWGEASVIKPINVPRLIEYFVLVEITLR
jgi:hypothetical protein